MCARHDERQLSPRRRVRIVGMTQRPRDLLQRKTLVRDYRRNAANMVYL